MNLVKLLTSPTADALGWTLLHAVWQGFAIVLPTAVALHLLRNRSSALRYQLGILALATQLLTSVGTFSYYFDPAVVSVSPNATQAMARAWQQSAQVLPWHQQVRQFLESNLSQFVALYLIGLVIFGLRLVGGWLYLQRLSRSANTPANALWNTVVNQLRATMALRPVIQIRESASIAVPIVVGILKPVLLIPVGLATSLSIQEIEAVLAHELAHVKRQDYTVNLLQSFIDILYFFHPALWWLSARVREERELCCDDLAIQACGGNGRRLAQALARIEELRLIQTASTPALAMAFATKRQQLLHRVRRILGVPTRPIVSTRSLAGLTLVTVLLVSASVYAVQQQQPKPKMPKAKAKFQSSKSISGSELHFDDKRNIQYVTWKGKKLTTSHVASLQRQWNQIMSGQLNLDNVRQTDRDILLSIVESDSALEKETHRDITASALTNVPLSPDGTVEGLVKVDYNAAIQDAFATLAAVTITDTLIQPQAARELKRLQDKDTTRLQGTQKELSALTEQMSAIMRQRQPTVDRLTKEMAQLTLIHTQTQKQLGPLMQQLSKLAQQQGALSKKLVPLQLELSKLEHRQSAKPTDLLRQKQQRSEQLEAQMNQVEKQIEALNNQLEPISTNLEPYNDRISVIGDSIGKLYEPTYALSERISKLSERIAADAYRQAENALRQAEDAFRSLETRSGVINRPARAPKAPSPPKLPIAPKPARPAIAPQPAPARTVHKFLNYQSSKATGAFL
jgi:beta-lactamase regulating signal transducer with metallopeptidase domain/predicted  nucleic acid-binding Zn-ribbon protein